MRAEDGDGDQKGAAQGLVTRVGEEAQRRAGLGETDDRVDGLRRLGKWITVVYGALCVANVAMGEPALTRAALFGGWLLSWGATEALLARGKVQLATWPLALGGLFVVGAQQWLSGGLLTPETGGYALVVLVSGLMGGVRVSGCMASLGALNAAAMWVAGRHGWLPEAVLTVRDTRTLLQQAAIVGLAALGVAVSLARIKKSAAIAERERALAKSMSESFQMLFMKSHAPMGLTEAHLREGEQIRRGVSANESFTALFEIDRQVAIEVPGSQMTLWRNKQELLDVRDELSARGRVDRMKAGMRTYDGSKRLDCLISAVPVKWEGIDAVLWTFQDVTENEALREELETLNTELEGRVEGKALELELARAQLERSERLAKLGEMVAGVAHEINTPIGNALLSASTLDEPSRRLLEMSAGPSLSRSELSRAARKVAEAASIAVENLGRASDIIKSFKQLSADQAGQTRRGFGFDEVVGGALRMIGPTMKARGVDWSLDVSEDARGLRVDGYPGALSQIVAAMASNAVEHGYEQGMGDGARVFTVRVEMSGSRAARIEFIDNGMGMAGHVAAKVFEPFFTTKAGKGGTGLGLAIAWNLAREALGGTLALVDHGAQGCRFMLEMPLESPRASAEIRRI